MEVKIAPSILSADFARLGEEADKMEQAGAHMLHVDVMDGHFVPNISIGIPVVVSLRKYTKLFLDVHLMMSEPLRYVEAFAKAGADMLVFHVECDSPIQETIDAIKAQGIKCGMTLKPGTPVEALFPYLEQLDMVLVMTVEPGFGGQKFMQEQCAKLTALRRESKRLGRCMDIEVDGGIDPVTISTAAKAGANVFVAGSALFGKPDYREAVQLLVKNATGFS